MRSIVLVLLQGRRVRQGVSPGAPGTPGAAGSSGTNGANGDAGPGGSSGDGGASGGLVAKSGSRLRIQQALDTSPDGLEVAFATGRVPR